jgi:hypothetical protein
MTKMLKLMLISLSIILFISGCASQKITSVKKAEFYGEYYKAKPKSILILPARNTTTAADATDYFRFTVAQPLAEKGFYVFPVHLVDSFFKSENISNAELIRNIPVTKLREIFNCDAVLYVDINTWNTSYQVVGSSVDVGLTFALVDAKNGKELWNNETYAYSSESLDGNNGVLGLIVSAVVTALNAATTDYTALARSANNASSSYVPFGPYHTKYLQDTDVTYSFFDKAKYESGRLYVDKYFIFGEESNEQIPLTVRARAKGYHAFVLNTPGSGLFKHNGYAKYYIEQKIENKIFKRNRFFHYENNRPFMYTDGKKIFVATDPDGTIHHTAESSKYYFTVAEIVECSK